MDAIKIIKRFESLEGLRVGWEGVWQKCSDYVLPRSGQFSKTNQHIFDSTAPLALGRFGAAMESILTPRTLKWHSLETGVDDLDQSPEVGRWLEAARDILFGARYQAAANFADQISEAYLSLGVHGTAALFIDDELGRGLRYKCLPVHEIFIAENAQGQVDTVYRLYKLTARQALQEFGEDVSEKIKRDADDPSRLDMKHEFIHGVFPREDYDRAKRDDKNMPVASVHLERSERRIVRESGYRVMPYAVSRFALSPGEVYGRSPAMDVLPDIVQVNAMKKTMLRAAEKMVNPPLLAPDDDGIKAYNLRAGAINFGGLDEQGRQMLIPLDIRGNLPIGLEMIEQSRQAVNEAFFINLFQILVETPQKTATEVVERAQEKAQLLAPIMGRQQSELLRPIIAREIDILSAGGAFDSLPMPEALATAGGAEVRPRYETPMAQAMSSKDGLAVLNAFQALGGMAQISPEVLSIINHEEAAREVWRGLGAPARAVYTPEEVAQMKAAQQQQAEQTQQAQMALEAAKVLPGAAKGMMEAEQTAQGLKGAADA